MHRSRYVGDIRHRYRETSMTRRPIVRLTAVFSQSSVVSPVALAVFVMFNVDTLASLLLSVVRDARLSQCDKVLCNEVRNLLSVVSRLIRLAGH